jgi:transcriptional regulator of heat shock response
MEPKIFKNTTWNIKKLKEKMQILPNLQKKLQKWGPKSSNLKKRLEHAIQNLKYKKNNQKMQPESQKHEKILQIFQNFNKADKILQIFQNFTMT